MTITIRPLEERHLIEADRIFRLAFGTFIGLPDPLSFAPGADLIATRWRAGGHHALLGAFDGDVLVGSNAAARWGSFGFFGPLTIRPDYWDKGIAQQLLAPTMDVFTQWGVRSAGLFTFPHSPKHLGLYQKFGFWPQHLTAVMERPVELAGKSASPFEGTRAELLASAQSLTNELYPGLDLTGEIEALWQQDLGEAITVSERGSMTGFAVCHMDTGSEAGSGAAYVKFAAVRAGDPDALARLLNGCSAAAARRGLPVLLAGVNTACHQAYRTMLAAGFRTKISGVAMQRSNDPGYLRPDALVIGDWR